MNRDTQRTIASTALQQAEEKARKRYEDDPSMSLERLRELCLEGDLPIPVMYYAAPFKGE